MSVVVAAPSVMVYGSWRKVIHHHTGKEEKGKSSELRPLLTLSVKAQSLICTMERLISGSHLAKYLAHTHLQ